MGALMAFRVGQEVVCVDAGDQVEWLVDRATYTIRSMSNDGQYLRLVGIFPLGMDLGFFSRRFRPIVKTDISIFTAMLAPSPKKRVDA